MARLPRLYMEGCAQHVIQRGNNRSVCFFRDAGYAFYLKQLVETSDKYGVAVHAYVLMTNHMHILCTPSDRDWISETMQAAKAA